MLKRKIISFITSVSMILTIFGTSSPAYAQSAGEFSNPLGTVQKTYSNGTFIGKPLIILMDFPDYKHTQLDEKESFRINSFKGSETTPSFYEKIFFGDDTYSTSDGQQHMTVNKFFKEESGGSYEFKGKVVGWYTADKNASYYGANNNGSDQVTARELVTEAINKASKDVDLSEFDVEDKWDIDGDGNYNEPDGIVDSLVVIHAGMGEEWGGGSLGENAIWPFRWGYNIFGMDMEKMSVENRKYYASQNPSVNDKMGKQYYIEDFTVFEQDLPVDLFDHEFGHVLGLPDLYSYVGATPPVENWSLMGGSYSGDPIGSQPVSYGAYCKQFLQKDFLKRGRTANWQNSKEINLSDIDENGIDIVLDQATIKGKNKDAVRINLPSNNESTIGFPEGSKGYFSGVGDNMENFMTTTQNINLANATSPKLTFKTWYDIDPGFDFVSVQVKESGSSQWTTIQDETGLTTSEVDPWIQENDKESIKDRNPGWGFTGSSNNQWKSASFNLQQFAGKSITLRFRFKTDDNTPQKGMYIDDIKISNGGTTIFADNAESTPKFTLQGFSIDDGSRTSDHYYLLEWRGSGANTEVDKGLDLISIYSKGLTFEPGLLVWYINQKYEGFELDQDNKSHPGEVAVGVVDADQNVNTPSSQVYQLRDATFSLREQKQITGDNHTFMNPMFDDSKNYSDVCNGTTMGLNLKELGLKVFVTDESKDRSTVKIHISRDTGSNQGTFQSVEEVKEVKCSGGKLTIVPKEQYGDKAYAYFDNINGQAKEYVLTYSNGSYVCNAPDINDSNIKNISYVILQDKLGNARAIYNKNVNKVFGADFNNLGSSVEPPVQNQAPTAVIDGSSSGKVNEPISFNGGRSTDNDGQIVSYTWDFGDRSTGTGVNASHTYKTPGTYTVTLKVTDDKGAIGQSNFTITINKEDIVENKVPTAVIDGKTTAKVNEVMNFDGSKSTDSDGSIASYVWNFGDGSTGTGIKATHSYITAGTYNVTLKVTDNNGATNTSSLTVNISNEEVAENKVPVAVIEGVAIAKANEMITFKGDASSDLDGKIVSYQWNFGDNTSSTDKNPSHTYVKPGEYTVVLTVKDDKGATGSANFKITIVPGAVAENKLPVAILEGKVTGKINETLQFNGENSKDEDGQIVSYQWNFGDRSTSTNKNPSHVYTAEGTYTVTLKVTDDKGGQGQTSMTVTITKNEISVEKPIVSIWGTSSGVANTSTIFSGKNCASSNGKIVKYEWNFGDGSIGTGKNISHTFKYPGSYTVTLKVTDNKGAVEQSTINVTISPANTGIIIPDNLSVDDVYVSAYNATVKAQQLRTQDSINDARTYVRRLIEITKNNKPLHDVLVGTLSSMIDPVQHNIFVDFYSIIYKADKMTPKDRLSQQEINDARQYVIGFLGTKENEGYVPAWSSAVDVFQAKNIEIASMYFNKAKSSKSPVDIATANIYINELATVKHNEDVLNFAFMIQDELESVQ